MFLDFFFAFIFPFPRNFNDNLSIFREPRRSKHRVHYDAIGRLGNTATPMTFLLSDSKHQHNLKMGTFLSTRFNEILGVLYGKECSKQLK